jgi:hypothetical protein
MIGLVTDLFAPTQAADNSLNHQYSDYTFSLYTSRSTAGAAINTRIIKPGRFQKTPASARLPQNPSAGKPV